MHCARNTSCTDKLQQGIHDLRKIETSFIASYLFVTTLQQMNGGHLIRNIFRRINKKVCTVYSLLLIFNCNQLRLCVVYCLNHRRQICIATLNIDFYKMKNIVIHCSYTTLLAYAAHASRNFFFRFLQLSSSHFS